MKKFFSFALVVVMLMTMSFGTLAAPSNLSGVITELEKTPPITRSVNVPVDIKVDTAGTGNFADGPQSITGETSATVNYKATIYMAGVRNLFSTLIDAAHLYIAGDSALESRLANCKITGGFAIKIIYPENAVVPSEILTGTNLYGFNEEAKNAFEEIPPRTLTPGESGTKVLTITISVKTPHILASDMEANLATYLPDITLNCSNITLKTGENKVVGKITGHSIIRDESDIICTIDYTGKQGTASGVTGTEISETVIIGDQHDDGGVSVGGGSSAVTVVDKDKVVEIVIPGVKDVDDIIISSKDKNPTINIDEIIKDINPEREGFVFEGFYSNPYYTNKLEGEVKITKDTAIYGRWINVTVPEIFDADDHIQYIHGYPDGTVRPEDNVTREEIATMFYRLLKEEIRAELKTDVNSFTDVDSDRWSNNAVSTMAKGGYIKGYEDGTFRPEGFITRAELATIASRFLSAPVEGDLTFNDIGGHWAEENIKSIANNAWIFGDGDGSFRPDEYITRAEAITIINRILVRYVNDHGLTGNEKQWPDNAKDAWYYHAIVEATHEHDHERAENKYHEIWSEPDSEMLVD